MNDLAFETRDGNRERKPTPIAATKPEGYTSPASADLGMTAELVQGYGSGLSDGYTGYRKVYW